MTTRSTCTPLTIVSTVLPHLGNIQSSGSNIGGDEALERGSGKVSEGHEIVRAKEGNRSESRRTGKRSEGERSIRGKLGRRVAWSRENGEEGRREVRREVYAPGCHLLEIL
eukprot:166596-Hanusia_phi.AAC.2